MKKTSLYFFNKTHIQFLTIFLSIIIVFVFGFLLVKDTYAAGSGGGLKCGVCRCSSEGSLTDKNILCPGANCVMGVSSTCSNPNQVCKNDPVNGAQCVTAPTQNVPTQCTCTHPDSLLDGANGLTCKDPTTGNMITDYKFCNAYSKCSNTPNPGTCVPLQCTCNNPGKPGAGYNGMTCPNGSVDLLDGGKAVDRHAYCAENEVCANTGSGTATCQPLNCTCDTPDTPGANNNCYYCNVNGDPKGYHAYCAMITEACVQEGSQVTCKDEPDKLKQQGGSGVVPTVPPPPPPCASFNAKGECNSVNTAFGVWGVDPAAFVTNLFRILLSLAGAIAVLIIMFAGYRLMMSQGDPERIQAAREQITAAIVGILFIVFSFVILEIIGVDLLKIPGFASGGNGTGSTSSSGNGNGTSTGGGRIDYGNDANPCSALALGANCGLTSAGTGLFCAGSCGVGGLADTLYQCVKSGSSYTTVPVQDCVASGQICLTGNGSNVPDYCGSQGSYQGGH